MAKEPSKKADFSVGQEVISYLRHSIPKIGKVPVKVKIDKIIGNYGRKTYFVSNDVGGKFPTRSIKKIK